MTPSVFQQIKEKVSIQDVLEHYQGESLVSCGSETLEFESKECPFCSHSDCFRVHDKGEESYYHCFSCGVSGDAISFVQQLLLEDNPEANQMDAVNKIEKDFKIKVVRPKSTMTEIERIFIDTAEYYSECLFSSQDTLMVDGTGYTPLQYQTQYRQHTEEWLKS